MAKVIPSNDNWLTLFRTILFESSSLQATPGKRVLGLKVSDMNGGRIGLLRAAVRHFSKTLSWLPLLGGFFMVMFTKRRQSLHDLIARTLVYKN